MKIIKTNSKSNYDFSEQKNFCGKNSLKERIVGDYNPVDTKIDASTKVPEAGNSFVEDKTEFSDEPKSKENNLKNKIMKNYNTGKGKDTSNKQEQSNTGNFRPVEKPVTIGDLVNKLGNFGKKGDFSKSNYDRCIDGYMQEGLTRNEAKFGCRGESKQVNSSKWGDAYDELDKEASKIDRSKKSSSSEGVTELDGRKLRNERHAVRHSPTDPQFNAKSTLASSNKKTGTYNGQKFDTKCRDDAMKMGLDRFQAAAHCAG